MERASRTRLHVSRANEYVNVSWPLFNGRWLTFRRQLSQGSPAQSSYETHGCPPTAVKFSFHPQIFNRRTSTRRI